MPNTKIAYNAKYWRNRAEQMRCVAELTTDPDEKQKMLGVAESSEKLAERAEQAIADETETPG
jgi:hypothetical protein